MPRDSSLYLDFDIAGAAIEPARDLLTGLLDTGPIASVLIRSSETGAALDASTARSLVALAQKKGVAALIPAGTPRAAEFAADGIHVAWDRDVVAHYNEFRRTATAGAIIGADAGRSRHDAMDLGEAGADYVAFGIPPHVEDRARAAERQLELISWWSEVFVIPCVAFDVADVEQANRLAEAGADFIAITVRANTAVADAVARVRAYSDVLLMHERSE